LYVSGAAAMEFKTEIVGIAPVPGSSTVYVSVEFGDELMTISVIVPNDVSDEQQKALAIGRAKSLARKFGTLH
jgi:hypothetical protein